MRERKRNIIPALVLLLVLPVMCLPGEVSGGGRLRLATTTSTDNSGLLEALHPPFEEKYGVKVDVIAVGTGKALALGRNGDVDAVLVHAREAEEEFVRDGHGVNRRVVMYNDFIILGPAPDPAGVKGLEEAAKALGAIASSRAPFVSRGDDSGTHRKEMGLWEKAGISPGGRWYLAVGQGMGASLMVAEEKQAYILADRGTYLAYMDKTGLKVLVEGDESLFNPYGVMAVSPARWPHVDYDLAMAYIAWITSVEGQRIIRNYTLGGEPLFIPLAVP